jgi:F-type H+-transporting ATPase subunit b
MDAIMPNFKVLFVQLLTFVLGMAGIWKLYIVPLKKHLKTRREGIAKDLASAENARAEAEHLRAQLHADRENMAEELKKAKEDARADVAKLRVDLLEKAEAEQAVMLKQAHTQIEAETRRAIAEVRTYAAELVVEATAKMLEKKIDKAADRSLAEKLVAHVKISKN